MNAGMSPDRKATRCVDHIPESGYPHASFGHSRDLVSEELNEGPEILPLVIFQNGILRSSVEVSVCVFTVHAVASLELIPDARFPDRGYIDSTEDTVTHVLKEHR